MGVVAAVAVNPSWLRSTWLPLLLLPPVVGVRKFFQTARAICSPSELQLLCKRDYFHDYYYYHQHFAHMMERTSVPGVAPVGSRALTKATI